MSLGQIKDYTPNFNLIIPRFDIATWHDYMESNFRSIDALFFNMFGINQYRGEWQNSTTYQVGDVLFIGDPNSQYTGRLVKVLVLHTTTANDSFDVYYAHNPINYDLFMDAAAAEQAAKLARDWAIKTDGKVQGIDYSSKYYANLITPISSEIVNVSNISSEIVNVSSISSNITSVDANSTNINTVAGMKLDIDDVVAIKTDIEWIADNDYIVTNVSNNSAKITTVANNINSINTNATNITDINTNASNISSINTTATNISDINTTALNINDINTAANISNDITIIANIASDITSVVNNATNINSVAANNTNISVVANNETNINAVASNSSNINTVSTNISDVNTAATNIVAIQNAPTYATNAANSASLAQDWATKMNGLVAGEDYSAKYYADQARQSAAGAVVDNISINRNTDDELQTVGVINQNATTTAVKTWTGTLAQYDAIVSKDSGTLYYLTDAQKIYYGNTLVCEKFNRNIGEIITSIIPLTDAGLHLLDGALIQGDGIYTEFYEYIVSLIPTYPQIFTDEIGWQNFVNTYGVCSKFVVNTGNRTVRLPKITGFIEGTIDSNALGDLVEAGLPNIIGGFTLDTSDGIKVLRQDEVYGAFNLVDVSNSEAYLNASTGSINTPRSRRVKIDASRSSSIYGNSSTVQPQSIKVFYYIVIATTTKTDIEVDIDEITTDLNSKANNADVVHLVGTETISGNKKFTGMTIFDRPINAGSSDLPGDVVTTEGINKSPNGYVKLGNGLIIQWGVLYTNSSSVKTVTLPTPFTTTNYSVSVQQGGAIMGTTYYCNTQLAFPDSTTSFAVYTAYNESCNVYWIAIGY
jgi:hypothetical protein